VLVAIGVLVDSSSMKGVLKNKQLVSGLKGEMIAQIDTDATPVDPEMNFVATDKDIEQAYKKLLNKRKDETEDVKTLKAEKGMYYRVELASGRSLRAVQIETTDDTVIITDDSGMVISLAKKEIADITEEKD
jgi:hypothetical protein